MMTNTAHALNGELLWVRAAWLASGGAWGSFRGAASRRLRGGCHLWCRHLCGETWGALEAVLMYNPAPFGLL